METPAEARLQEESPIPACASCGTTHTELKGKNHLCPECHQGFVKFNVPMWIKAFGVGLLIVLVFSLYQVSGDILTGIHVKRGERAAAQHNYLTAEKEFAEAVQREPLYTEAEIKLMMAAYNNHDFVKVASVYNDVANKSVTDDRLFTEMSNTLADVGSYFPSDSLNAFFEKYGTVKDSLSVPRLTAYLSRYPDDLFAMYVLSNWLMDDKKYAMADSLLDHMLAMDPGQYNALSVKAPLKREIGQFDSSFYYVDKLLAKNHEDTYALSAKARTLLKQKKDQEALEVALKSTQLNPQDGHALASLALAYHYLHDVQKRDALMQRGDTDSTLTRDMIFVKDIISGKELFRN